MEPIFELVTMTDIAKCRLKLHIRDENDLVKFKYYLQTEKL